MDSEERNGRRGSHRSLTGVFQPPSPVLTDGQHLQVDEGAECVRHGAREDIVEEGEASEGCELRQVFWDGRGDVLAAQIKKGREASERVTLHTRPPI